MPECAQRAAGFAGQATADGSAEIGAHHLLVMAPWRQQGQVPDSIRFGRKAASALAARLPGVPAELPAGRIPELASQLLALRDRLRAEPA